MEIFDGLVNGMFKKDSDGNTLFYPWGILASGFVLRSDIDEKAIRGFIKKCFLFLVPFVLFQVIIKFWFSFSLVIVFTVWYLYKINNLTKGLSKSTESLTLDESIHNSVKSYSWIILIVMEVVLITGLVGSFVLLFRQYTFVSVLGIMVFFLCSGLGGRMIYIKFKS